MNTEKLIGKQVLVRACGTFVGTLADIDDDVVRLTSAREVMRTGYKESVFDFHGQEMSEGVGEIIIYGAQAIVLLDDSGCDGRNIRRVAASMGVSARELAERIGCSYGTVVYQLKKESVKRKWAQRIADALECDVSDFK